MIIAVSSQGDNLDSPVDPRFGRAAYFVIYDTDNGSFEVVSNATNVGAAQGAGIQAAQLVAGYSPNLVISGNIGPKAFSVLEAVVGQLYLVVVVAWFVGMHVSRRSGDSN